ncbi:hypothetical protein CF319_g8191, partial [Tilletia indica]
TSTSSVGGGDALAEQHDVENDPEGLYIPPGEQGQPHEADNDEDDEDNEADEEDNGDGDDYWDPPSSPVSDAPGSQLSHVTVVPIAAPEPEAVPANPIAAADPDVAAAALLDQPAAAPEGDDAAAALLEQPAAAPEAENEAIAAAAVADIPEDLAHLLDDDDFDWDWQPEYDEPEHNDHAVNAGGVLGPAAAPPQPHEDDDELEEHGFSVTSVKRAGDELNNTYIKTVKVSAKVVCEWIHDDRSEVTLQPWEHDDHNPLTYGPGLLRARRLDNDVLQVMVFPNIWASATGLLLRRALLPPSCDGCRDEAVTISVKVEASP